jgi:hypothetical protein
MHDARGCFLWQSAGFFRAKPTGSGMAVMRADAPRLLSWHQMYFSRKRGIAGAACPIQGAKEYEKE